jgi:PAS domain S-box-containing protein
LEREIEKKAAPQPGATETTELDLEGGRDGLVFFDIKGRISAFTPSLGLILGREDAIAKGARIHKFLRGEGGEVLRDHLEGLRILGFVAFEAEAAGIKESPVYIEAAVSWIEAKGHFRMAVRDITVKKRLDEFRKSYAERLAREVEERTARLEEYQKELQRQKATAEGIIQGCPLPMFVLDRDHRIIYWNKACERLTGFKAKNMIGTKRQWEPFFSRPRKILADLVMEGDEAEITRLYKGMNVRRSQLVEGAYEGEHFFKQIGPEGTHLYVNAAPIFDDSGEVQGAIVTYLDVSERAALMAELSRREAYLNNLIQNSIDGIIATDSNGLITIYNNSAQEILGYTPAEILGRMRYQDILSEDTGKAIREAFYSDQYGPPGKILNMITNLIGKSGEPIPVRFSGTLIHEGRSEIGSVVFIQDLRELHRLQREKDQAERMAAIGRTVAGVAHYIKNILSGLKGGAYVVRSAIAKKDLDLTLKGWEMVERNLDHIGQVTADMLSYAGERRAVKRVCDPREVATEAVELMRERAKLSGVLIEVEFGEGLGEVSMDRNAIYRCLLNLIGNAIDACTLKGMTGEEAKVKVIVDRPEGWGVRYRVIDSGAGMDEETQRRLFTDFFTTKGYAGTGLGLPVTRKMVEDHGGRLLFDSEPGKGTTFSLLLP